MPMQMQTLSARVPTEDVEWLAALDIQGAISPSDKLRTLIAQMRRQYEGAMDYAACVSWLRDLLAPVVTSVRTFEHQNRTHSEVLTLTAEWLPQIMATLLSERALGKMTPSRAHETEEMVVQRCFQLLASLLRLAVTREAACYDPAVIERHLPAIIELAEIVNRSAKTRMEDKRG
jgi:hypothetical protein